MQLKYNLTKYPIIDSKRGNPINVMIFPNDPIKQRCAAIKMFKHWYEVDNTARKLFDYELKLSFYDRSTYRDSEIFIICNQWENVVVGLEREALLYEQYYLGKVRTKSMLKIIGNDLERLLIFGSYLKDLEYLKFPRVLIEDSKTTVVEFLERDVLRCQMINGHNGEESLNEILGINDLPF